MHLIGSSVLTQNVLVRFINWFSDRIPGPKNFEYGIDRYVVIYPDGRGYAWHELNDCGEKLYDGSAKTRAVLRG